MYALFISFLFLFVPPQAAKKTGYISPLESFSKSWNNPKYKVCNTAENATYMTAPERQLIYILNLARMNPKLFCETVVKKGYKVSEFIDTSSVEYYKTLVTTLNTMQPVGILYPDQRCTESARCHALTSGKKGYTGHARQSAQCKRNKHFMGECCNYGSDDPLEIILLLLQDLNVSNLGHREICLGNYTKIGVAIERHRSYSHNAVMDFY